MNGYMLHCGDCAEVMWGLEAGSVDSIIVDPPYGTEDLGGGYGRRQKWDTGNGNGRTIAGDKDLSVLENSIPLAYRLAKENTWHAVFCAPRKIPDVANIVCKAGFDYFGEIIWNKQQPGLGYTIRYQHETILIFKKGEPRKPETAILSVITCSTNPKEVDYHPHVKPLSVMMRLVSWLCPIDGITLDFCMGSGTTGVAAIQTRRRFIGVEKDAAYFEIAERRIRAAQPPLFIETSNATQSELFTETRAVPARLGNGLDGRDMRESLGTGEAVR